MRFPINLIGMIIVGAMFYQVMYMTGFQLYGPLNNLTISYNVSVKDTGIEFERGFIKFDKETNTIMMRTFDRHTNEPIIFYEEVEDEENINWYNSSDDDCWGGFNDRCNK